MRYLFAVLVAFVQTSALAIGEDSEEVLAKIQLPPSVSVNYADLTADLYATSGRKLGRSIQVSTDLTFVYPAAYDVGLLQIRKKSAQENRGSTLFLVAGVYVKRKEVVVNALTTVRALFTKEIQDVYSRIQDADKPQAEQLIVALLPEHTSRVEHLMRDSEHSVKKFAQQFVNEESFKNTASRINAALASAIESSALSVRVQSPVAQVRKSLEALISCQSNPLTYGTNPAEEQSLRMVLRDEFKRSGDGAVLRREIKLFGAKVTQIFPGSLGTSPAFAAILQADMKTLRANVTAAGIDLSRCTKDTCELEVNAKATLLMADSALFTGNASKSKSGTLMGCVYPYVR